MIILKLFFVLLLTHSIVFCGFSQDKKASSFTKFSFIIYCSKPSEQIKKFQEELKSKQGIYISVISEKGESFVVVDHKITYKDISEVARVADCKIVKQSEIIINRNDFEELEKKLNDNTSGKH